MKAQRGSRGINNNNNNISTPPLGLHGLFYGELYLYLLLRVSAAYAGHHQAETHKIIKEKYMLMGRSPLYS
jgi:hypothetical protein